MNTVSGSTGNGSFQTPMALGIGNSLNVPQGFFSARQRLRAWEVWPHGSERT